MIKFLKITETEAYSLMNDSNEIYTPFKNDDGDEFYIYKENIVEIASEQVDGLTPMNPTKPMYPRKN